jgi:hypothetical protein
LYKSLRRFHPGVILKVLVTDADETAAQVFNAFPGMQIIPVQSLFNYNLVHSLYHKYAHIYPDSFRWALKPVFIQYLLENGFEKVLFTDCDIFFFEDYTFLLDDLDSAAILLTPHWHNSDPVIDERSFLSLFTGGVFNAGFIGANRNGLPALAWWANACHYKMGAYPEMGVHDDQRYLDLFPVKFEFVKIVRHRGCNIGGWNRIECARSLVNGRVLINDQYPIVFIHFGPVLIEQILKGHDPLLLPYLKHYRTVFEEGGTALGTLKKELQYHVDAGTILKLKWRVKIRTRVKSFLFKLAKTI